MDYGAGRFDVITFSFTLLFIHGANTDTLRVHHLSRRSLSPLEATALKMRSCDQSMIPVMDSFDTSKFSGGWYELGKTVSGFLDPDDGLWKFTLNPSIGGYNFIYSGRTRNNHCIRPITGIVTPSTENPGELLLKYETYSAKITERLRILETDYDALAIVYTCMYTLSTGVCHPAGVSGAIWTRKPHVDVKVFNRAVSILDKACIDSHSVIIRPKYGQSSCRPEDFGIPEDHALAPDFCYQQMNSGSCSGSVKRYYYDAREKICKDFTFGGCAGNDNNFMSIEECEEKCVNFKRKVCETTVECGLHCPLCCRQHTDGCVKCDCQDIVVDEFVKCVVPSQCSPFCSPVEKSPGCHVCLCDEDPAKEDRPAICLEVKQPGTCSNEVERYYYNAISEKCEKFAYSGCGGNSNNFETISSCMETCKSPDKPLIMKANVPVPNQGDNGQVKSVHENAVGLIVAICVMAHYLFSKS